MQTVVIAELSRVLGQRTSWRPTRGVQVLWDWLCFSLLFIWCHPEEAASVHVSLPGGARLNLPRARTQSDWSPQDQECLGRIRTAAENIYDVPSPNS